jgi:hypothetical protein
MQDEEAATRQKIRSRRRRDSALKDFDDSALPFVVEFSPSSSPSAQRRSKTSRSPMLRPSPSPPTRRASRNGSPVSSSPEDTLDHFEDFFLTDIIDSNSPLISLPHEVVLRVLALLTDKDLARVSGVCKSIGSMSRLIWMEKTKSKYPEVCLAFYHASLICES